MDSFLLALLLVFALALGGRDQWLVALWADALGRSGALLAIAIASACAAAGVMAWVGAEFAAMLPRRAAQMLVAFALALAAAELALPVRVKAPREPTRSLGAIGIVLFARQVGDGARFVVFALAAGATMSITAALGGALAGAAAVTLGWSIGAEGLARLPLRPLRWVVAACLIVAALFTALNARFAAS
jgi:putative Ca2+/H+ antiporter (TMEM165/GDT1 family)